MRRVITAAVLLSLGMGCEPELQREPEPPPGVLEYEHPYAQLHRLDRRVDAVLVEGEAERRECGILSERAYTELTDTLAALDPRMDYGYDPEVQDCTSDPGAWVHVDGFENSPFLCSWNCCHSDLIRAALIYSIVEANLQGGGANVDGEPYITIEPDTPCP
ncbi:hypothetical protein [Paraliomyxa miuraensis]|uniref:hypothetical protein n=1 Tax=Paraliomyxa miuraensis TaxID=376150 RepID=UPI0022550176|nr:hypothetical protein [Paraliomyxa miuraensis]MCX4241835.1 hypothetical protein [Paraliomyxa miuraensis]